MVLDFSNTLFRLSVNKLPLLSQIIRSTKQYLGAHKQDKRYVFEIVLVSFPAFTLQAACSEPNNVPVPHFGILCLLRGAGRGMFPPAKPLTAFNASFAVAAPACKIGEWAAVSCCQGRMQGRSAASLQPGYIDPSACNWSERSKVLTLPAVMAL